LPQEIDRRPRSGVIRPRFSWNTQEIRRPAVFAGRRDPLEALRAADARSGLIWFRTP